MESDEMPSEDIEVCIIWSKPIVLRNMSHTPIIIYIYIYIYVQVINLFLYNKYPIFHYKYIQNYNVAFIFIYNVVYVNIIYEYLLLLSLFLVVFLLLIKKY